MGEHLLKDFARPEHVFQLQHPDLPGGFPPLKSLDNTALPNNLPQQVTNFIGREKELSEVQELLSKTRLLTLTGAGGSGKSRLSLQAAAELLEDFPSGVFLMCRLSVFAGGGCWKPPRRFARDRLLESSEGAAFRDTHLAFFLALGEELEPQINSPRMKVTLDRMEEEIDNFRAARELSGDAPARAESGLRLTFAVTNFMRARGYFTERQEQLSRALESSEGVSSSLCARGRFGLGSAALRRMFADSAGAGKSKRHCFCAQ